MKLISACFLILLSVYYNSVFAGEVRLIELNDGSVISGEIVSFSDGVYTISSSSLGTLQIEDTNIRAIRSESSPTKDAAVNPLLTLAGTDLQGLLGLMMGDPEVMNKILLLQNDPDFQAVLQDPEVMSAVMSGDINALLTNPTFMKLLEHQQVQEITKELDEKTAAAKK